MPPETPQHNSTVPWYYNSLLRKHLHSFQGELAPRATSTPSCWFRQGYNLPFASYGTNVTRYPMKLCEG